MSYAEWLADSPGPDWKDRDRARRWNLLAETRIPSVLEEFRGRLGDTHADRCAGGGDRCAAALQALNDMAAQTTAVGSPWLGRLPLSPDTGVPAVRFVWATFDPEGEPLPDDPATSSFPPASMPA